jgi:hypothetical protein
MPIAFIRAIWFAFSAPISDIGIFQQPSTSTTSALLHTVQHLCPS